MTTASQVRTAAQLERLRLATEVARARAAAESQARQAESQTAAQAREAISETEQQAQVARSEVGQEAESRQAEIRKQRGQAEREAEAAKAQARQTQRVEQRKAVLPVSKPRDLGLASYVTNVETARKQAHQVGGSAKTAVTKVRDDYFQQVDKARDDAIADINKQKAGIVKDIQKQLVDINADLTKQLANANSGVAEWEKDSQSKIAKAQADYEAAIKATLNRSGTEVFADMKGKGLVPASAVYESYDKATGQLNYTTPDTRSGQEIFADLRSQNKIAPNASYQSYDAKTGEVSYKVETPNFGSNIFKRMQNAGTIPKDATFIKYDNKNRTVTYFLSGVGATTIPETTGLSPSPDNSVTTSTSSSTVGTSQNSTNVVGAAAAMAGLAITFKTGAGIAAIPTPPTWIIGGAVLIAAGIATYFIAKKVQADLQKQGATEQQVADAIVTDKDGTAAYSIQQFTVTPTVKGQTTTSVPLEQARSFDIKDYLPNITPMQEQLILEQQRIQPSGIPISDKDQMVMIRDRFDVPELHQKASNMLQAAIATQTVVADIETLHRLMDVRERVLTGAEYAKLDKLRTRYQASRDASAAEVSKTAQREYARRQAILDAARKAYVASLNPQPIKGKGSTDATAAAIGLWLAQDIIQAKIARAVKEGKSLSQTMAEAKADIKEASQQLGLTQQQINAATATTVYQVALSDMAQAAVQAASQAQAQNLTATQIQTQTLEATRTAAQTAVQTAVQTQTLTTTQAAELAQSLDMVAEAVATTTAKIKLPKIKLDTDTERRKYPDGTVVWKMGETKRGEEYKIIPPPYTMLKPISSRYPPKGMTKTKGTPQETLTFIGGKVPFENVSFDLGVTDGFIDVKAKKIQFTGQGEQTNVGTRIASTTKGVALKHNPPMRLERVPARPRRGRLVSHGVYADTKGQRISRRPHRHWKRIY